MTAVPTPDPVAGAIEAHRAAKDELEELYAKWEEAQTRLAAHASSGT